MQEKRNPEVDRLFDAILTLKTRDDCYAFFEDLCTIREVLDMSQRLTIAILLNEGRNYQEIEKLTGVSSTTISRVRRCLMYGSGGYEKLLAAINDPAQNDKGAAV